MALALVIVNDGTGDDDLASYDVDVRVNRTVLVRARVEGFARRRGWEELLGLALNAIEEDPIDV